MSRLAGLDIEWIDPDASAPGADVARPRRARRAVALTVIAGVVIVGLVIVSGSREPQTGSQAISPSVTLASGASQTWAVLAPADGSTRDGWPRPMIARGSDICFGFEHLGFEPPRRPSLARCVDAAAVSGIDDQQVASLMTIRSGLDIWHVLLLGAPVSSFELAAAGGAAIGDDRIHIADDIVALRLAADVAIATITWRSNGIDIRCDSPAEAVVTGQFCPIPTPS